VWDGHLESRKNPDRLKRSIHVDRIGIHSTFVYIHAGLRALMIWANCLFSFNMSFLLRKVEDVTTISKSQSLTSVSIKDCTMRVPNETTTLFLLRVIIKAIFILHTGTSGLNHGNAHGFKLHSVYAFAALHITSSQREVVLACLVNMCKDGVRAHLQTMSPGLRCEWWV